MSKTNIQLESDRLILKNYRIEDLDNVNKLLSEPLVWRYSSTVPTCDIEEARKHLVNTLSNYKEGRREIQALYLKGSHEYIGEAGILSLNQRCGRAVVGYNLLPSFWGCGYATEITKTLVKYLFEDLKVERIEALVCNENEASKKVLEKSGLIHEGLLRNFGYINDRHVDVCYYGMIKSDYFNK